MLVAAGADTKSAVRVTGSDAEEISNETPLDTTNRCIRAKRLAGKEATEEQLNRLEGIRRLLLRVDAAHAVSWLWHNDVPMIGCALGGSKKDKGTPTLLSAMLPALRRRARRDVLLPALFLSLIHI